MGPNRTYLLIAPAMLVIGIFMLIPLFMAVAYSFMTANPYGGVTAAADLRRLYPVPLSSATSTTAWSFRRATSFIILRSIYLAIATTGICLVLGLPVAWYIVCQTPERRRILLFVVTLPFWINTLIRTYCWILILRDEGLANDALRHARHHLRSAAAALQ